MTEQTAISDWVDCVLRQVDSGEATLYLIDFEPQVLKIRNERFGEGSEDHLALMEKLREADEGLLTVRTPHQNMAFRW